MSKKQDSSTLLPGADLVLDAALTAAVDDRLDHAAIAKVVADLTMHADTPVNMAIFGAWGSGKSSFFGLLRERLEARDDPPKIASYDAWKFGGRALKKHFVGSIAGQIGLGGKTFEEGLAHDQETTKLDLWGWVRRNWGSLVVGLLASLVIAAVWFVIIGGAAVVVNDKGVGSAAQTALASLGTVLSLSFAALLLGPRMLDSAVVKITERAPQTDDEFARSFEATVSKGVDVKGGERLVVFIDELDRCSPADVVATLIDLKTFLDARGCVFVVAADREVLERALRELPQANPVRGADPYYSTPGAFLDKIFQHQIPLPPLRAQALTRFAQGLVERQTGLWSELRSAQEDDRLFLRVVYGLVPVHVRSPRRVKVLLNNYATNVRVAQARGMPWLARAEELATLTVLETEFPSVVADLVRFPSLLKYLRDDDTVTFSPTGQSIIDSYRNVLQDNRSESAETTEVAGALLVDPDDAADRTAGREANKILVEDLLAYLRRIAAAGFQDPRPDLLYLQSAGAQEGIADPDLAETIDLAAEYSADHVVARFATQPSSIVAIAVRLLSQQADLERGPGQLAIIESVCRLTEHLDPVDVQAVAPVVAGSVLSEVSSPDWPAEATPGAIILGVVGASQPLVRALLRRQDAETVAAAGTLGRIAQVLAYASDDQATLVYELLGAAYYTHPAPLHDALRDLPPDTAEALWKGTSQTVKAALEMLSKAAETVPAATIGVALPAAEPTVHESAAERYEALLTSVETRPDNESALVISSILKFGQGADEQEVRTAASNRAEEALKRISDPAARNEHAMLGLRYSPLSEASWWAKLLSDSEPAPDAYGVFEELVDALASSPDDETDSIIAAVPAVIPHIPADELGDSQHWIGLTLGKTTWLTAGKNRAALYSIAGSLRPRLAVEEASALDAVLAADLVAGLDVEPTEERHVEQLLSLVTALPASVSVLVEELTVQRTSDGGDLVLPLRLRLAAAERGSGGSLAAADLLTVKGVDGDADAFEAWMRISPPLSEVQQVLGNIPVYSRSLDRYAGQLDLDARTALWIDAATNHQEWRPTTFGAIGKHGVGSQAIEFIATAVSAATQQNQRDALIDRLGGARLVERPEHSAATDLVLLLLRTGIAGDAALAARVAIQSGGAAHGRITQVRSAFDATVAKKPNAIRKGQQDKLRAIGLLSKPPKRGVRGLIGGLRTR
jgi:hypothetical protein